MTETAVTHPLRRRSPCVPLAAFTLAVAMVGGVASAQTRPAAPGEVGIAFNFPEAVELRTLVDYVSRRLDANIVYDADLADAKNVVTIRSPRGLPADALLPLLRSVLRMKGFTLVDGEEPGWSRVVKVDAAKAGDATAPTTRPTVQFVTLKHAAASRVSQQVKQLIAGTRPRDDGSSFDVIYDDRTNQIGAMGAADVVADAIRVAQSIDVDVPSESAPIRFYKLTNATAADVLDTIRELQGKPRLGGGKSDAAARASATDGVAPRAESAYSTSGVPGQSSPDGGAPTRGLIAAPAMTPAGGSSSSSSSTDASRSTSPGAFTASTADASALAGGDLPGVTADANTNTIIVMGGPEVQNRYLQLITQLDKRRPQVLLEATIVTLDTTNQFRFGVELAGRSAGGGKRVITFSQFGLSTVDANTGRLSLEPGLGFNGAIVGSDVADVIVQALQANGRTRVQSAPRVLVNDNATGTLSAVAEQPFTSTNASNTVATTSFGGYAEAGTTIALTPHISDDDYLQLEYSVELSSFTGTADAKSGSPPPRQTNKIDSKVTIPDGSTIIVGGLNRSNDSRTNNRIPILGDIPILGALFGSRQNDDSTSTLFVFLRPIILRDDQFKDLKNLSERDTKAAGIPGDFPQSSTLLIRG